MFLQGTEETVGRVSFGNNLAPSLFKGRVGRSQRQTWQTVRGRSFRGRNTHQLRRDLPQSEDEGLVCGMQAKESGCPQTVSGARDHAAFPPSTGHQRGGLVTRRRLKRESCAPNEERESRIKIEGRLLRVTEKSLKQKWSGSTTLEWRYSMLPNATLGQNIVAS